MFKINYTGVQTFNNPSGPHPSVYSKNVMLSSGAYRSTSRMGMNIANFKTTRGCGACGK